MENDLMADRNYRLFDPTLAPAYLEAIPTTIYIVDIFELDISGFDFANKWITALLAQRELKYSIHTTIESSRKIEHLYFSTRNSERIKGYKNLGFGYPILTKKDSQANSGLLSLPIFIWDLQLEPHNRKEDHWNLLIPTPKNPTINPVLKHFGPGAGKVIAQFEKELAKKGFTLKGCIEFCAIIAELLGIQNDRPNYDIEPFPDLVDLSTLSAEGTISWAGILSIFPPIIDYSFSESNLSKDFWKQATEPAIAPFQFSYLNADHQQKAAQIAALKNKFVLVDGPAGTGKNHTICNIIISNLLNEQRTLVVGQSVTSLEKIVEKLANEGFGEFLFLFRNLTLDQHTLLDNLIIKAEKTLKTRSSKNNNFSLAYQRFNKFRLQIEKEAAAYASNVFDINNWTETVGLFLKNSRLEGKELLDPQLQVNDFVFDFLEYDQLLDKVLATQNIFREHFSFYHPLDELTIDCFAAKTVQVGKQQLVAKFNKLLKKTRSVQRRYFQKVGLYKNALENHYEQHYLMLKSQLETIKDLIDQMQLKLGKGYDQTSVGNLKILKTFSGKSKTALNLKSAIIAEFEKLKVLHFQQPVFDFGFLDNTTTGDIVIINQQLTDFEQELVQWRIKSHGEIQDNIKRLNSKTALPGIAFTEEIAILEKEVDVLVNTINDSNLFIKKFKNNGMTLQLKQQLLDELVEKINSTLFHLRDFEQIFEWRNLVATLSEKEKNLIDALIKVRPDNWTAAFDTWYFHNLLSKESRQSLNFQPLLNSFLTQFETVKEKIPAFVREIWKKNAKSTLHATKKEKKKSLNNFLKKADNREKFAKWFKLHLSNIASFYPVLCLTTEMAKELLGETIKPKFDSLIINNGTFLSEQQGGSLLALADKVQVFGNGKSNNAQAANSFWQVARSLAGKHIILKTQHRKNALSLLAFSQAAFDHAPEYAINSRFDQTSLIIHTVNGDYDEDLKINDKECQYMLSVLTSIEETPHHTYPKVGFVCATIEQRNLFASYLLKIKQTRSNGVEKIQHLERNGMGVYFIGEVIGQQFDILIVSLTFGIINAAGELTKDSNYFKSENGSQLIQSMLNRADKSLHLFHSFPLNFIKTIQRDSDQMGLYILSNLIQFGLEIQEENPVGYNEIIRRLSNKTEAPKVNEKGVFLGQVAHYLSAYFEQDRILLDHTVGSQIFPLIIKGKKEVQGNYVIQADSFFNNVDVFSYLWQEQSNRALAAEGFKIITLWSRDWWRNPEAEARKLASQIIKEDSHE